MSYKVGDKVRIKKNAACVFDGQPGKIVEVINTSGEGVYVSALYENGDSVGEGGFYWFDEVESVDVPSDTEPLKELSGAFNDPEHMFFHTPQPTVSHVCFRNLEASDPGSLETVVHLPTATPFAGHPLRLQLTPDSDKVGRVLVTLGEYSTVVFLKDLNKALLKLNT